MAKNVLNIEYKGNNFAISKKTNEQNGKEITPT